MESNYDARDSLSAVETDRERLGDRMTAETHWAAPAQGLAAAVLIGAPAAGIPGVFVVLAVGIMLFVGIEWAFRRRSGLSISRPAGPRGMALLVLLTVLLSGLGMVSFALWVFDMAAWILPVAVVGGLLMALGVRAYDHTYSDEVRRAR
ncbi:hypothetical protein K2F54_14820 [Cryobacterium sp. 1639]|uniref:hypothetical protein n=1 Tax=Cryobacterium inferilacus TaxID=2866629 RepID=UPI001C73AA39|nr:hypothetical protein [Cryobacterium sp. 1639]MBX0301245.1 hypothetical protein [Cryobacterium sp. 1639]